MKEFKELMTALRRRSIKFTEINNTISVKLGAGVFLSRNMIKKRFKRKDGIKYDKTVNPRKYGFKLKKTRGLLVLLNRQKSS